MEKKVCILFSKLTEKTKRKSLRTKKKYSEIFQHLKSATGKSELKDFQKYWTRKSV